MLYDSNDELTLEILEHLSQNPARPGASMSFFNTRRGITATLRSEEHKEKQKVIHRLRYLYARRYVEEFLARIDKYPPDVVTTKSSRRPLLCYIITDAGRQFLNGYGSGWAESDVAEGESA
jgi:hypothetical protein